MSLDALVLAGFYPTFAPEMFHQDTPRTGFSDDGCDFGVLVWPHQTKRIVTTAYVQAGKLQEAKSRSNLDFHSTVQELRRRDSLYEVKVDSPQIVFFDNKFLFHTSLENDGPMNLQTALSSTFV